MPTKVLGFSPFAGMNGPPELTLGESNSEIDSVKLIWNRDLWGESSAIRTFAAMAETKVVTASLIAALSHYRTD